MGKIKWERGTLRVFSRHPSHSGIRNKIVLPKGVKACIRLGSLTELPAYKPDIEINSVEGIQNTMNKLKMKELFSKAGVKSPYFIRLDNSEAILEKEESLNFNELYEFLEKNSMYPLLAKRTYRSRGIGMEKLDNREELEAFLKSKIIGNTYNKRNPYYLEQFKNYVKEYRIHVSEIGYFYSCRKMLRQEFVGTDRNWFRNDSNSVWIMEENPLFEKPGNWKDIIEDCILAIKSLSLSIGAVDVKVNKKGEWAILEVNSAPSFGEVTTQKYINHLKELLNV